MKHDEFAVGILQIPAIPHSRIDAEQKGREDAEMMEKISHKAKTRARILDEAASVMHAGGADGFSVAELMKRAGLTHGGFYAHFSSRDELVTHAVDRMFEHSEATIRAHRVGSDPAQEMIALFDYYLSEEVLEAPDHVCPLPGLSGGASRLPPAARERLNRGAQDLKAAIERVLGSMDVRSPDTLAASVLAEMVGAMALARASSKASEGQAILRASRSRLKERMDLLMTAPFVECSR